MSIHFNAPRGMRKKIRRQAQKGLLPLHVIGNQIVGYRLAGRLPQYLVPFGTTFAKQGEAITAAKSLRSNAVVVKTTLKIAA